MSKNKLNDKRERVNNPHQIFGLALKTSMVLFCTSFLFFGLTNHASASTYTVCASGCSETTIQAVFDNNDLAPGDIVEVQADTVGGSKTYNEMVTWGTNDVGDATNQVILQGRSGDTVTIDAQDTRNYVIELGGNDYITLSNLIFSNSILRGLNGNNADSLILTDLIFNGGVAGFYLLSADNVTCNNLTFTGLDSYGMYFSGGSAITLSGTINVNNSGAGSTNWGLGFNNVDGVTSTANITITNQVGRGIYIKSCVGGAIDFDASTIIITGGTLGEGAIYIADCTAQIFIGENGAVSITGNAQHGIMCYTSALATGSAFYNITSSSNTAGDGFHIDRCNNIDIYNAIAKDNSGISTTGSGMRFLGSANINIYDSIAESNRWDGFNILEGVGPTQSDNIKFYRCQAANNGDADEIVNGAGDGFTSHDSSTNIEFYSGILANNKNSGVANIESSSGKVVNSIQYNNGVATATRAGIASSATGGWIYKNNILEGNYPRELQFTTTAYVADTIDYNLYYHVGNEVTEGIFASLNATDINTPGVDQTQETYLGLNEVNSMYGSPLFTSAATNDFTLNYLSPAIDAGTDVSLTTDYDSNSIYGLPDIGAYEYQPPYTIGTDNIPTTGSIRIYSDGKYRMKTASSTADTISFSITPPEGSYYSTTTQYMDITIDSWLTTGTKNKQWTATSTAGDFLTHATSTLYTIGDLSPNTYYTFKLDSTATTTAITGTNCTDGVCLADSNGEIIFTYSGGYSTHTFALEQDVTGPNSFVLSSPASNSLISATPTLSWGASSDSESGLSYYQLYIDGSLDTDNISGTSVNPASSLSCGNHTWYIRAYDNNENYTNSNTFNLTMVCGGGLPSAAYMPPAPPVSSPENPQGGFKVLVNDGIEITNNRVVSLLFIVGPDTVDMAISEDPAFKNVSLEPYQNQKEWTLSEGDGQKIVYVKFYNKYGQATTPIATAITLAESKFSTIAAPAAVATDSEGNISLEQIENDATIIITGDVNQLIAEIGAKRDLFVEANYSRTIVEKIVKDTEMSDQTRNAITNFVAYGTKTTQLLGAGERAGIVNSFKTSFGKLPTTQEDWFDIIKIANGRWPNQRSKTAEDRATINFRQVYLRNPDLTNPLDDAAITVMAYGLRPADRNLNSEKTAIKSFKAIYGYTPSTATAWDVIRAIAYSGAKR